MDQIHLDVHNVVETLGGQLVVEARNRRLRDKVMVAAMDVETVRWREEPSIMMLMGDREVAEAIEQPLTSPHSIILGGVMSRKKQVIPILPRVARKRKGRAR